MESRRLEFCSDEAYKSLGHTTHECKSEASCTRRACLFEEVHMFNMDNIQRAYRAQNGVCSDREESLSLGTQIQYANRFCHRQASACFINALFLLGAAALCSTGSLPYARNAVQCGMENQKSQPHIMPSVSLNSKPTGFFRILKRFLFSFSLSVV